MNLCEVPLEDLKTGDKVVSVRGRPGVIIKMSDIGVTKHHYIIVWSSDGKWSKERNFISVDANIIRDLDEYPIRDTEIKYLGRV